MAEVAVTWARLIYSFWREPACQLATSVLGTAVVVLCAVQVLRTLWFWIRPSSLPIYCHSESGSWALVTGASDGIGRALSEELLDRGFNVLLHGRNLTKLQRIRDEMAKAHPKRSVDIVVADASKYDDGYRVVTEKVKELPGKLTILINNVGGIATKPQYSAHVETTHDNMDIVLNLNARFQLHLTKDLIPVLQANGPSLILNCGSTGALFASPYITTYVSTKAFIHQFSLALKNELAAEGMQQIEVLGLMIGNVKSAGNPYEIPGTLSSRQCAAACLDRVGCGAGLTFAHWTHALQTWVASLMPERMLNKILIGEMQKRIEWEEKNL